MNLDELDSMYVKTTKDLETKTLGRVSGGIVKEYANGSGKSQVAMFCGSEEIQAEERDMNAAFYVALHNAYRSLSAKIRAADKFLAAYNACDQNQNEDTEQALLDALDEYGAIK